jgi:hypothetical protein
MAAQSLPTLSFAPPGPSDWYGQTTSLGGRNLNIAMLQAMKLEVDSHKVYIRRQSVRSAKIWIRRAIPNIRVLLGNRSTK